MRLPSTLLLATVLSGCLGGPVKVPDLRRRDEIAAFEGHRVRAHGTIVRPEVKMGPGRAWNGTGLELADGTVLWVSYARELPPGWVEGQEVSVDGFIWTGAPPSQKSVMYGPHLSECSTPVPAGDRNAGPSIVR